MQNEAKAYLTLVRTGSSCAQRIAGISHITRQDVYRVMNNLEQSGLVETVIGRPLIYRPVSIDRITHDLAERKYAKHQELKRRTRDLLSKLGSVHVEKKADESGPSLKLVKGREATLLKLEEALKMTKTSVEMITTHKRFSAAIFEFKNTFETALKRGVCIRMAMWKTELQEPTIQTIQGLMNEGSFELRLFDSVPESVVSIFDGIEVSVVVGAPAQTFGAAVMWSRNKSLVALARGHFRNIWNNSAAFC